MSIAATETTGPMDCTRVQNEDVVERYLRRELAEEEQAAFEAHYFECEDCYGVLSAAQAVPEALRVEPRQRRPAAAAWPMAASLAAALLGGTLVWRLSQTVPADVPSAPPQSASPQASAAPSAAPPPALRELAAVVPPPYVRVATRGADERSFTRAMALYARGEHAQAAALLRAAWERSAQPAVGFYLGVCELVEGRDAQAAAVLERVASGSDPLFAEPARLYLAKAHIRLGQLQAARSDLDALRRTRGPAAAEARDLLARLDALGGR